MDSALHISKTAFFLGSGLVMVCKHLLVLFSKIFHPKHMQLSLVRCFQVGKLRLRRACQFTFTRHLMVLLIGTSGPCVVLEEQPRQDALGKHTLAWFSSRLVRVLG